MTGREGPKQPVSFRWRRDTVERLRDHAHAHGDNQTDLTERYVLEGMRTDDHPLIQFRSGMAGRRAALLGTRLDVADIISTLRQNGNSIDDAAEYLDVPGSQVEAVVRYYVEFQDEIDAEIERAQAVAQRERQMWERQQKALG